MTLAQVALLVSIWLVTLLVSLTAVVAILLRLPSAYFTQPRGTFLAGFNPALRVALIVLKNLVGVAVLAVGVIMSIPGVPGQGFLTIFIGLMLMDFPGKYRLERAIIRRPAVHGLVNGLRRRYGRPPLIVP